MSKTIFATFPRERERGRPGVLLTGRDAWALEKLAQAGPKGVTPITTPGPRWSAYVFNLRRLGFNIETRNERHGPPFAGTHARYVLHEVVSIRALAPSSEGGGD
ncbi:winged helix domain-containing protein [Maricaulaceae bacterium MS644]